MLSAERRESLGHMYSLVGTHSAVKLCRWQKSMMRGRGGCYKWTMYGIQSHRCMEATPSLGCANKCTFCWRLNSNPTITEWKYKVDEPKGLVNDMITQHQALVKNAKGMVGCLPEKYDEALQPRHCALSLVGEPIIYPKINEFVDELHSKGISTFLVNNGQFPEAIRDLKPITQLYLSVDAADREMLKELDRPAFPDYWERMLRSIDYMREKKCRTVFRLTLIQGFNMRRAAALDGGDNEDTSRPSTALAGAASPPAFSMAAPGIDDAENFASLIIRGRPDFVELKQLTPAFQGNDKSPFRLSNVPSWDQIVVFARAVVCAVDKQLASPPADAQKGKSFIPATGEVGPRPLLGYSLACGHEHSSCLLLARNDYELTTDVDAAANVEGPRRWKTWIDFDKWRHLTMSPGSMAADTITAHDYAIETPQWALFEAPAKGFDPKQTRFISNRAKKHLLKEDRENGTN